MFGRYKTCGAAITLQKCGTRIDFRLSDRRASEAVQRDGNCRFAVDADEWNSVGFVSAIPVYIIGGDLLTRFKSRYDVIKRSLLRTPHFEDTIPTHLISALSSGTLSVLVCAPIDVVKSRIQSSIGSELVSLRIKVLAHFLHPS